MQQGTGRTRPNRWPAVLVSLIILGATAYSFSPRSAPPFPDTAVRPDGLHLNSLLQTDRGWVAVGEQGHILVAPAAEGPWTVAEVSPQRGSTLTRVHDAGGGVLLAGGHDGWILRSEDGGQSWTEVAFDDEATEPVLDFAGPVDGRLFAVGGFGLYRWSDDGGRSWETAPIVEARNEAEQPSANPFAMASEGLDGRHLNGILALPDGRLLLVGESGLMARSADRGATWERLPPVYRGSFFGALPLPDGAVLAYGMRGHVFLSRDGGDSWERSEVPVEHSLFGGRLDAQGRVVLVGAANTVLRSTDGGRSFTVMVPPDRATLADVLALPGGGWLTASEDGLRKQGPAAEGGR